MSAGECIDGACGRCRAGKLVVIGALVLLNIYAWPKWTDWPNGWFAFIGVLLIIKGVLKFLMPSCPHCKGDAGMMKMGAKKGK